MKKFLLATIALLRVNFKIFQVSHNSPINFRMKKLAIIFCLLFLINSTGKSQESHNILHMDIGLRLHGEDHFNYSPLQDVDGKITIDRDHVYIHVNDISITLSVREIISDEENKGYRSIEYTATDLDHLDKLVRFCKSIAPGNRLFCYSVEYDQKVLYGFYIMSRYLNQ